MIAGDDVLCQLLQRQGVNAKAVQCGDGVGTQLRGPLTAGLQANQGREGAFVELFVRAGGLPSWSVAMVISRMSS